MVTDAAISSPGSISAWAEKPSRSKRLASFVWVDLRVGGEAPGWRASLFAGAGRSPRGRRSRVLTFGSTFSWGSISAWAEKPDRHSQPPASSRVDLRVGGEATLCVSSAGLLVGRSPRGRRSPPTIVDAMVAAGSISAWAEKPVK